MATGNEIVPVQKTPQNFQIRNINSHLLLSLLKQKSIPCLSLGIAADKKSILRKKLEIGLKHDLLLISGSVSAGKYDLVPSILEELGCKKIFHKVSLKPGRPLWFGRRDKTAIFGMPGNPVSVHVCWSLFVEPYIHKFLGLAKDRCFPCWETRKYRVFAWIRIKPSLPKREKKSPLVLKNLGIILPSFVFFAGR